MDLTKPFPIGSILKSKSGNRLYITATYRKAGQPTLISLNNGNRYSDTTELHPVYEDIINNALYRCTHFETASQASEFEFVSMPLVDFKL
jgi:hypothetical protein